MIGAVIFDMDGLLFDTEGYWQITERKVFGDLGIGLTPEMQNRTMGLRSDEVVKTWFDHQPWKGKSLKQVEDIYNGTMLEYYREEASLMEGAREALEFFHQLSLPMGLASSSHMFLIDAFLDKYGFHRYFREVYSAEFEPLGKPHPGVYLETARRMGVHPFNCLALEDSFNGMLSAKSARMKTIVVPEKREPRFEAADVVLDSLLQVNEALLAGLNAY